MSAVLDGMPQDLREIEMGRAKRSFMLASIRTMNAKWWELWLATLFGHKQIFDCGDDGTVKIARWRRKNYLLDYVPPNKN